MAQHRVLRFDRSDDESGYVLLQVTPSGSKPLDLKLIATEGEAPYVATLKNGKVSSLMVKNCPVSDKEWHDVLVSLLGQEPLSDIQATATVQSGSSLSITIRKQVQGITQRLGSIILNHDENEAIELFEWCGTAAGVAAKSKEESASAATKLLESSTVIEQLKTQLEELIQAKQADESALLHKFRDLLNEKKVKIREQQKLLAVASFHQEEEEVTASPSQPPAPEPKRRPAQSRSAKRKTHPTRVEESSEGEDEDAERMDVDEIKAEPQDTESDRDTEGTASVASDDDTGDEEEADAMDVASANAPQAKSPVVNTKELEQPPPKRELPFANRKPTRAASKPAPVYNSDSDDEL